MHDGHGMRDRRDMHGERAKLDTPGTFARGTKLRRSGANDASDGRLELPSAG